VGSRRSKPQPIERFNFIHPAAQPQFPFLPRALVELADVATNGECFWPGDWAADAARALARHGQVILGGEVYCRRAVGWAAYLGDWVTSDPEAGGRSPDDDVARGLDDALRAIARDPDEWGEPGETLENLRFFFAAVPAAAG
jgi:hypothetical protein